MESRFGGHSGRGDVFGDDAQLVLHRLELAQRFAELDAVIAVLQHHFEHAGHGAAEQSGVQGRRERRQQRARAGHMCRGAFIIPAQGRDKTPMHAACLALRRSGRQQQQGVALSG